MEDIKLTCKDCGDEFTFTVEEQEYISDKVDKITGDPYQPPKRCKPCRHKKKARFADLDLRKSEGQFE